jgi:hypothetical protein
MRAFFGDSPAQSFQLHLASILTLQEAAVSPDHLIHRISGHPQKRRFGEDFWSVGKFRFDVNDSVRTGRDGPIQNPA